ncbi:MAG: hypothetical protein BMS9Abin29_2607 [Gemmatimonadota bacterium]|nr:MAG: hypothetical protein BMS9Abin29_2607 [Gemmatimonadota bacterium]
MVRRTSAFVSALIVLVLAGCQDSGPFGLVEPIDDGQEAFDLKALIDAARKVERPVAPPWNPPTIEVGGPAAVHAGFPNLLANGGFENGDFSGWSVQATGTGIPGTALAWQVGATEDPVSQAAHAPFPHTEPLANSGLAGASAVQAGSTNHLLVQDVVLPVAPTITISWQHRFKNFFPEVGPPGAPTWFMVAMDYRVELQDPVGGLLRVLWQASLVQPPPFSGGGNRGRANYEFETFDISEFSGQAIRLAFVIEANAGPLFVDIDDVEIFAVLAPGGTPTPVAFDDFDVEKAKVKLHKPKKHEEENDDEDGKDRDQFEVEGEFTLGDASDGFDLLTEDLTITFGDLEFVIDAGSLVRERDHDDHDDDADDDDDDEGGWRFRGEKPGITGIEIEDDGRFKVKAEGLDLSDIDLEDPVTFTLMLGDDAGSFDIDFDRRGKFERRHRDDDDNDDADQNDDHDGG